MNREPHYSDRDDLVRVNGRIPIWKHHRLMTRLLKRRIKFQAWLEDHIDLEIKLRKTK